MSSWIIEATLRERAACSFISLAELLECAPRGGNRRAHAARHPDAL